jgi:hypothetical protein
MSHEELVTETWRLYGGLVHTLGIIEEGEKQDGQLQNFVNVILGINQ